LSGLFVSPVFLLTTTHGCTVGYTDAAPSLTNAISIVAVGAVTNADAGFRVYPCYLASGAAMAEAERTIGVSKAAQITLLISRDRDTEGPVNWRVGELFC
jgi:hypothetical protein